MAEPGVLAVELAMFERHRNEWVHSNSGQFVVIVGVNVEGFFPDYEAAFNAGLNKAEITVNFLVKQVWAEEPVYLIY